MMPYIETNRLSLRRPAAKDAARITTLFQDQDVVMMLGRAPWPYTLADAESWIRQVNQTAAKGTEYAFAVCSEDAGMIGSCGMFHVQDDIWEIGYWIGKPYWGQGYVTEAAQALLGWAAEELQVTRFISGHIIDNPASGRVLEKLGFSQAGIKRMYVRGRDCEVDAVRYALNTPGDIALGAELHQRPAET